MYVFSNSLSYYNLTDTRGMFFNKSLLTDLQIEYPYELVKSGKWTFDKLTEICKQGYRDLNGNSEVDNDDQFGFLHKYFYAWLECFEDETFVKNGSTLEYRFDMEKNQKIVETIYALLTDPSTFTNHSADLSGDDLFANGHGVFIYSELRNAAMKYSQTDVSYGIVPMPKLDENQSQYYGAMTDRPYAVPKTASEHLEETGLIIEALSAEGYRKVFPAFFEQAMKVRYADQTEDAEMMDIIYDNVILSFTYMYGENNAVPCATFLETLLNPKKPSTDVASYAAKIEKANKARCEKLTKFFNEQKEG